VFERLVELPQAYAGYDGDDRDQNPHVYGNQFRPYLHLSLPRDKKEFVSTANSQSFRLWDIIGTAARFFRLNMHNAVGRFFIKY
jgi:hypothetical protein